MSSHDYIKDDGAVFEIVPSTRRVTVPTSHRIIGVVGEHNSEQITIKCPKTIDGHNVGECKSIFVVYKNASNKNGKVYLTITATDDDYIYLAWVIDGLLAAKAGYISFSIYFEDKDDDGNLLYRWLTTANKDCQILDAVEFDTSGALVITANGAYDVSGYTSIIVNVITNFTLNDGSTLITSDGLIFNAKEN